MTFLEIMKLVDRLALTQGSISTVTPTNEFQLSMVERCRTANHDLHMLRKDWLFNWVERDISVSMVDPTYTPTDIRKWESVTYNGNYLRQIPYTQYLKEDWTDPKEPFKYTISPSKTLIFNTVDANYIVQGNGYLNPDELVENNDVPRIPGEYHYLLVYATLISLGSSIAIGNIISEYIMKYNIGIGQMMRDYVPSRRAQGRPLV